MTESTLLAPETSDNEEDQGLTQVVTTHTDAVEALKQNTSDDCNATASCSHPSSSETGSLNNEEEDETAWLTALARQLEFYFSPANLARDTYLQTVRSGHDGYVPASILANFAKVTSLCPIDEDRVQAVAKAVSNFSTSLEVVSLSHKTLKKLTDTTADDAAQGLVAVGLVNNIMTPPASPARKIPVQNVIILREVNKDVTEDDVRSLFQFDSCPPLESVRQDVANCWFVTLDTSSREDVMNVMLDLRSKKLQGESVKARLKSASMASLSTLAPPFTPGSYSPGGMPFMEAASPRSNKPTKKKNKELAPKSPSKTRGVRGAKKKLPDKKKPTATNATAPSKPPPALEDSHFPALATPAPVLDNMDEVHKTDAASTTTTQSTSTSSLKSFPTTAVSGGYAAALLKAVPPVQLAKETTPSAAPSAERIPPSNNTKKEEEGPKQVTPEAKDSSATRASASKSPVPAKAPVLQPRPEPVPVVALSWGRGRSFADVIKEKEKTASQ